MCVCVCVHMYVCVYVYMLYARREAATHDTSEQNVSGCEHTRVYACAYAHTHAHAYTRTHKQARKMEKSMKPAVPVAGGLDTSTTANTSMAAPAARDMTRKLTPRDRDPSQVHSVLMLCMCV